MGLDISARMDYFQTMNNYIGINLFAELGFDESSEEVVNARRAAQIHADSIDARAIEIELAESLDMLEPSD